MKGNIDKAKEYQSKWKSLFSFDVRVTGDMDIQVTGDTNIRATGDTDYEYSQWDQRTHNVSYVSKSYETSLWIAIDKCVDFVLLCGSIRGQNVPEYCNNEGNTVDAAIKLSAAACQNALSDIRKHILNVDENKGLKRYLFPFMGTGC
jgi:hypothetical protein